MRRRLVLFVFALLFVPTAAAAHSQEVSSDPADGSRMSKLPNEVTFTFDERPTAANVAVTPPAGVAVAVKAAVHGTRVIADMPKQTVRGPYSIAYRVVSADGHPLAGVIRIDVTSGELPSPADPGSSNEVEEALKSPSKEPARGPLVPIVIGVAILGVAATVFAARSIRQ